MPSADSLFRGNDENEPLQPKAFQFIEGRPSTARVKHDRTSQISELHDDAAGNDTTGLNLQPLEPVSPQKPPPSTPATRLPLAELIGNVDDIFRTRSKPQESPEEHIAWSTQKSPRNLAPKKTPARAGTKRARSSSPPSSSQKLYAGLQDLKHTLKTPKLDPATELWNRYASEHQDGISANIADMLKASSPNSAGSTVGNVSGLRRWTSCGIQWPTSAAKRRKVKHTNPRDRVEEMFEDLPPPASDTQKDREVSRKRMGLLIERLQESLQQPALSMPHEEQEAPSSSSPLPDRESPKVEATLSNGYHESLETQPSPLDTTKKPTSSAFGSDELDAGMLNIIDQVTEPPERLEFQTSDAFEPTILRESPDKLGLPSKSPVKLSQDEFGDMGDSIDADLALLEVCLDSEDDGFDLGADPKSIQQSQQLSKPVAIQAQSFDEFDNDDIDDESFAVAEAMATQSRESAQSKDNSGKGLIQRYLVQSVHDAECLDKFGRKSSEKVLLVLEELSKLNKVVTLRGSWFDTRCSPGSYIHVIGTFNSNGEIVVDDDKNLLILHPDHLVSALVVAESFGCLRKAVLQDRVKATSEPSAPQLYGTMLHEIFQAAVQAQMWDDSWLANKIVEITADHIEELYQIKLSTAQAMEHLQSKMPQLQAWADIFVQPSPGTNATVNDSRADGPVRLSVSRLLDVEEHIWSPMYGLKGNIDATVQLKMQDAQGERTLIAPFEVKTGRNTAVASHRAQTTLYTLLLSDRYDVNVAYGILYYLETSEISRLPAIRHELRHMIMKRNELAGYIRENLSLPPMLKDVRTCSRCYAKKTCFLYHRLSEDGSGETSGLRDKFDAVVRHLSPAHQTFFRKWDELLTKEESEMTKFRRELWTMPGLNRERLGRCFANVVLEPSSKSAKPNGSKINRFQYTFRKLDSSLDHSFGDSHITTGEPIVVSDMNGHYALAKGYVTQVDKHFINVAVDRRLQNTRQRKDGFDELENQVFIGQSDEMSESSQAEPVVYRIDKDEFSNGLATVRNNLLQIMDNETSHAEEIRRLVIDGYEPRFKPSCSAYELSGPTSQENINSDQRAAIEKILAAEDYALVLGMPGTGKTTTIAHIIRALVAKGKSVLLTSYTHTAVDNILLKIRNENFEILRLGALTKVHPEVHEFATLAAKPKTTVEELKKAYDDPQIVATTCLGINHPIFHERVFDYCIVDEASQITLPVCLGPIRMARCFILVGDHYQLPPLVQNKKAQEGGLDVSLFKLLSEGHPKAIATLRHQYRMNESIMSISNSLIYGGQLVCGSQNVATSTLDIPDPKGLGRLHVGNSSEKSRKTCDASSCWLSDVIPSSTCPVVFLNTDTLLPSALERAQGARITNFLEAALSVHLVMSLLVSGVPPSSIGVITLYRSQLSLIKSLLHSPDYGGILGNGAAQLVEAHTADRYQGRDKDVIILSCVRNNEKAIVGDLLKDWRRVNVSVTRARKKLIIIGSKGTLSRGDELLGKLVGLCEESGWMKNLPVGAADEDAHCWNSYLPIRQTAERTERSGQLKSRSQPSPQKKGPLPWTSSQETRPIDSASSLARRPPLMPRSSNLISANGLSKPFKVPGKVGKITGRALAGKRPVLADIVNDVLGENFLD